MKHFHEQMMKRHDYKLGYTVTRLHLQVAGRVRKAAQRSVHCKKRARWPLPSMLLHQDVSPHALLSKRGLLDLVGTLDDATSTIYSAILVEQEGTMSTFAGPIETIAATGLLCSLYTDRGSHYFHKPEAGGKVAKDRLTQVGRALAQLGIEHIVAYSRQARPFCASQSARARISRRRAQHFPRTAVPGAQVSRLSKPPSSSMRPPPFAPKPTGNQQ